MNQRFPLHWVWEMKIKHRLHNGETRYIVNGKINGKRRREQFDTKKDTELFLKHQVKEPAIAAWWTSLTLGERVDIHASYNRAKEDGFSLLSAVETHSTLGRGISYLKKMTLDEAIGDLGKPKRLTKITNKRESRGFLGAKVNAEISYAARHTFASTLRNFRDYVGESKQVISVTSEQIEGFLNDGDIKKKSWAIVTRKNYGQAIHNFFGWCIRKKIVKENPVISLEKINVDPFDPKILTVKECKQLLKFCWKLHSEILPLLVLNLFCGIRPSECRRLRSKGIRFEDNEVVLPAKSTKTKRRRIVSISDNARRDSILSLPSCPSRMRTTSGTIFCPMRKSRWSIPTSGRMTAYAIPTAHTGYGTMRMQLKSHLKLATLKR